ncbi:MAG: hypothetical protein J5829_02020 [Lachnospiraceae bacterium]|nr:hypothetical protein [Lachnospiraceae bacterium]
MDTTLLDDVNLRKKWFSMSVEEQISNIGGEVNRAINWWNKGNKERARNFCNKAKELLQLSIEDPKNRQRTGEFFNGICELDDRFFGDNKYNTTDVMLRKYYDAFI